MTFDEIMNSPDFGEKETKLKKYYIEDIDILSWCCDTDKTQKVFFKDRLEIKKNGKLHNIKSAAIKYKDGQEYFFIEGEKYEKDEWEVESKRLLRIKKLENILED